MPAYRNEVVNIKSFALDENGDLIVENGDIQMVHGVDLTKQNVKCVLGTQKGEWFLNWSEGINFEDILGKRGFATQVSAIGSDYIALQNATAEKENRAKILSELLKKRLDGEI